MIFRRQTCVRNFVKIYQSIWSPSWSHTHTSKRKSFLISFKTVVTNILSQKIPLVAHASQRLGLPLWFLWSHAQAKILSLSPSTRLSLAVLDHQAKTLSGGLFRRLLSDHQRSAQITGHSSLQDNLLSPVFEIRRVNFSSEDYLPDDRLQQCRRVHNDVLDLFVISQPGRTFPSHSQLKHCLEQFPVQLGNSMGFQEWLSILQSVFITIYVQFLDP